MEATHLTCEEVAPRLLDWLAGELPAADQQGLETHLASCPACRQELATVRQLWQSLGAAPAPSEALRPNFYAMLAGFQAEEARRQRWSWAGLLAQLRQWWQPAYAGRLAYSAALLLLGLLAGYGLKSRSAGPATSSALAATAPAPASAADAAGQTQVLALLANPSAVQRLRAVSYAEDVAPTNERVAAALLSTLSQDPNVNVRLAALEVLAGLTQDPAVRQGLVRALPQQDSPLVQAALADMMVQLQERGSVRPLRRLLQQDNLDEQVKRKIRQSIKTLSGDQAAPAPNSSTSHETQPTPSAPAARPAGPVAVLT